MSRNGRRNIDMTEGVIWKQLVLFAIPLILGDLLQQLYNTADSIIVGRFVSKQALAAVSSTQTIINTVIGVFSGISTGAAIVISRCFGAKDREELQYAVHTTISLTLLVSVVLTVIGVCGTPWMLRLMDTPEDVFHSARVYLQIYFAGIAGLVLYNMSGGILRAIGDSRRPLYALMISAVLNVLLDVLFVVVFHWGVIGVAVATIFAQLVSSLFLLVILCRTEGPWRLDFRKLVLKKGILLQIFDLGLPIGLQKSLVALSNTVVISRINYFGSGAMAAWGVYRKLDQVTVHVAQNLSLATSTFVGQNLGAGREERIRKGIRAAMILSVSVTVALSAGILLFRKQLIALFNTEADVLYYGDLIFRCLVPVHWLVSIVNVLTGSLRGRGDSKGPTVIMLLSYVGLRQLYLHLVWGTYQSIPVVVSCYPLGWAASLVAMTIYAGVKSCGKSRAGIKAEP